MKYLALLLLFFSSINVPAQNHYTQKVYPYVQKQVDGYRRHFVHIEMPGGAVPLWDSAVIDGKAYTVHFSAVEANPLQVGERLSDKRMVNIKQAPDTKLWMLDFDAADDNPAKPNETNAPVVLTGKLNGRKLSYKILTEVELVSEATLK